jgi:dihydropteroate synthase
MTVSSVTGPVARLWHVAGRTIPLTGRPLLMGIVNVTPDSFSDGGQFLDPQRAIEQALRLEDEGAQLLDLGAESTRPGATPVGAAEEAARLLPVIEGLAPRVQAALSIDTSKASVAAAALERGAHIINDISGLRFDPELASVVARAQAGLVLMHSRETPATMQDHPHYHDVLVEVTAELSAQLSAARQAGIAPEQIVIDPGIGFGKTAEHNLTLLGHVAALQGLGYPVLIGHSRKRFLKRILGREVEERLAGTLGVSIALAEQGVDVLRIHDVAATRDAIIAWRTVRGVQGASRERRGWTDLP